MSKDTQVREQPATVARLEARHEDARQFAAEQARASAWKALPGSKTVGFMDLRGCMCRWPVSDPAHATTVRYCGDWCSAEVSYCETHRRIAVTSHGSRSRA